MARDLRIYVFSAGTMHKSGRFHKHQTVWSCMGAIKALRKHDTRGQYLIVEYTDKYEAEIIYISPFDVAKTT